MAKYTRTRKYTRYRRRSNWASNIEELSFSIATITPGANISTFILAENPPQDNTRVSQVYTVKNFEINYTVESPSESTSVTDYIEDICAYIVYLPQGMSPSIRLINQHPEYVMAMKFIGSPAGDGKQEYQPHKITSRLARRLNTGDAIMFMLKFNNTSTSTISGNNLEVHGIQRWWTKTN